MPIEFSCPTCSRPYKVKDELAGKTAKCGKCGNRMQIPGPAAAKAPAAKSPAAQATAAKPAPPKPLAPKPPAPKPALPKPVAAAASAASGGDLDSWLDEELAAAPPIPATPPGQATCPKCGATQQSGALICGKCGHDIPAVDPLAIKPVAAKSGGGKTPKKARKKISFNFKMGSAGTLVWGTFLSFVFAMVGALIWAVVAFLTGYESGFIAWGLGGLAGFGMALGHDDDDGTLAGIVAAFVSLVGIVAAKVLVVVIFIAFFVAAAVNQAGDEGGLDTEAFDRQMLSGAMSGEKLKQQGIDPLNATDEQWKNAEAEADAEVAKLTPEEIQKRLAEWREKAEREAAEAIKAAEAAAAAEAQQNPAAANAAVDDEELDDEPIAMDAAPGFVALFFSMMFHPIDGIFMLLAFFTAYKVGSGKQGD